MGQIRLLATMYDDQGQVVLAGDGASLINSLMPGIRGPFDVIMVDPAIQDVAKYVVEAEYEVGIPKSQVIDVTSAQIQKSAQGDIFITGEVYNKGDIAANMLAIVATIYDQNGNISRVQMEPDFLRSGHKGAFVTHYLKDQIAVISDYALMAESDEYAAVPEFPLESSIVLLVSSVGYVITTRSWTTKQQRIRSGPAVEAIP